jgi:hypothetical protein
MSSLQCAFSWLNHVLAMRLRPGSPDANRRPKLAGAPPMSRRNFE